MQHFKENSVISYAVSLWGSADLQSADLQTVEEVLAAEE